MVSDCLSFHRPQLTSDVELLTGAGDIGRVVRARPAVPHRRAFEERTQVRSASFVHGHGGAAHHPATGALAAVVEAALRDAMLRGGVTPDGDGTTVAVAPVDEDAVRAARVEQRGRQLARGRGGSDLLGCVPRCRARTGCNIPRQRTGAVARDTKVPRGGRRGQVRPRRAPRVSAVFASRVI